MHTEFCPECGRENSEGSTHCADCGAALSADSVEPVEALRPTRWLVVLTAGLPALLAVLLGYISGLSYVVAAFDYPAYDMATEQMVLTRAILIDGSAFLGLGPFFGFMVGALLAALIFRGRYLREVALGAAAGTLLQTAIWVLALGSEMGLWLTADLHMAGGPGMRAMAALVAYPVALFAGALLWAHIGWICLEQITGKGICLHCEQPFPIRQSQTGVAHCAGCGEPVRIDQVRWLWALVAAVATSVVYFGSILIRPPAIYDGSGSRFDLTYLIVGGVIMTIAPTVLAFVLKRGARETAGAAIVVSWAWATFLVMAVTALRTMSEGAVLSMVSMQVLALLIWGIAGSVGLLSGHGLRSRLGQPAEARVRVSRTDLAVARDSELLSVARDVQRAQWRGRLALLAAFATIAGIITAGVTISNALGLGAGPLALFLVVGIGFGALAHRLVDRRATEESTEGLTEQEIKDVREMTGVARFYRRLAFKVALGFAIPVFLTAVAIFWLLVLPVVAA